jgi:hypothetical protein
VAEFRALVERQVGALGTRQAEALKTLRRWELELGNLADELADVEEALRVEAGALMQARQQYLLHHTTIPRSADFSRPHSP